MATVSEIFVKVQSDITGLQTGLAKSSAELQAFSRSTATVAKTTASSATKTQGALTSIGTAASKTATTAGGATSRIGSFFTTLGSKVGTVTSNIGSKLGDFRKTLSSVFGGSAPFATALVVGAIGKVTLSFEDAFTKIGALSNASTQDIAKWKTEILTLAGETAQAPTELADALFFLSSAGLKANEVFPALEASAQAAATGLGSTADVANIVASAMNAYSKAGLTATNVTDTLVAAVREGRAEPEAFATALGRVLPIASQAGVSFQDVTASLAQLSNVGLDVDEGVTAVRGALQALIAPGSQAAKTLASLGLTAQDLLDAIHENGLIGALRLLDDAAKRNTSTQADYIGVLRQVIPNVRALTGVLGLTGQAADVVDGTFQRVADSTGAAGKAFGIVQAGPGFAFRQFLAQLQVVAIELGEQVLPTVVTSLKLLAPVLEFAAKNAKELVGAFLLFKGATFVKGLFAETAVESQALAGAATEAAAAETAAAAATGAWATQLAALNASAAGGGVLTKLAGALSPAKVGLAELAIGVIGLRASLNGLLQDAGDLANQFQVTADQAGAIKDRVNAFGGFAQRFADPFGQFGANAEEATAAFSDFAAQATQAGASQDAVNAALQAALPELTQNRASIGDFTSALQTNLQVQQGWAARQKFAGILMEQEAQGAKDAAAAQFTHARSIADLTTAIGKVGNVTGILDAMGTSLTDLAGKAAEALRTDKWKDFATEIRSDASKALDDFRQTAFESLDFTSKALDDLGDQSNLTATEILTSLKKAADQTKSFGADIVTVSKIGGAAGHDLAQHLLEAGDVLQAQVIADAPKKIQDQIVSAFGKGETAADSLAAKLTTKLLGTMQDIEKILQAIAKQWNIKVDLQGNAKNDINDIKAGLESLPSQKVVDIIIKRERHQGGLVFHTGGVVDWADMVHTPTFHAGGTVTWSHEVGATKLPAVTQAVKRMHTGGLRSDEVPAVLQRGEFVIQRSAVEHVGVPFLDRVNRMHTGGSVGSGGTDQMSKQDLTEAFRAALRAEREKLYVDRRRFGRDLDQAVITNGSW